MSLILLPIAAMLPADPAIIVTAYRHAQPSEEVAASASLLDGKALDDIAVPALVDLLRLTPGVAVATTGPRGTQAQVRIRGAEANHTLLFLDGIRFNDPAAGNEARFELLTADSLARVEIVRGPQSALWGSEAIGGVVAVETADPFSTTGFEGLAEYGSLDTARLYGRHARHGSGVGLTVAAAWQRSDGIDSFGARGERDGFEYRAASVKAEARSTVGIRFGAIGHWIEGDSQFDGFDSSTFMRADTLDSTENRIGALRGWAELERGDWTVDAEASYLDSANRNFLDGAPLNVTFGDRLTLGGEVSRRLGGHRLTFAIEHQTEHFSARDTAFFGGTDQDRSRHSTALAGEWQARWRAWLITDLAIRHDAFSAFADATTFRASLLVQPATGLRLHAAYAEGIAQPTFYDLFGFFPGSFVGNPGLAPEHSRGWEGGIAWSDSRFSLGATFFSTRLRGEIVDVFDPVTFSSSTENADGTSRRHGLELVASLRPAEGITLLASYGWLDADDQRVAGTVLVREVRRPRHAGSLIAHGESGRFRWGMSLAYVGHRRDSDFDLFPAAVVTLDDYVLASANLALRIVPQLELFARAENGLNADYQDVVGYNTPGRTLHAGIRVTLGN